MDPRFFRHYLDILNEAPAQPNQPQQDLGTQIVNKGGQMAIDSMKGLSPSYKQTHQNLTPGSEYYQKNIANNPNLVKQAADVTSRMTPDQFDAQMADTQQRFTKVTAPNKNLGADATSQEYTDVADKVGLPAVK